MRLHETRGARSMQSHPQDRIDSKPEPSPMAIVGAILAQGAIRILRREERLRVNAHAAKQAEKSLLREEICTKSPHIQPEL